MSRAWSRPRHCWQRRLNSLAASNESRFAQPRVGVCGACECARCFRIFHSFTALSLIESVCVHYFFFLRESDLTPLLFSVFGVSLCCGSVPKHHEMSPDALKNSLSSRHAWDSSLWKDPNCGDGNRKNAEEFLNRIEEENNRYWQKVARWIDEFSRWVIPPAYVVCVAIMLGTQKYRLDEGLIKGPTYEGYKSDPSINITAPGPTS